MLTGGRPGTGEGRRRLSVCSPGSSTGSVDRFHEHDCSPAGGGPAAGAAAAGAVVYMWANTRTGARRDDDAVCWGMQGARGLEGPEAGVRRLAAIAPRPGCSYKGGPKGKAYATVQVAENATRRTPCAGPRSPHVDGDHGRGPRTCPRVGAAPT